MLFRSETGLWFPDLADIAKSFKLDFYRASTVAELAEFSNLFARKGPVIIDCICTPDQEIFPSQALKNGKQAGLHDMAPFLSEQELATEMIVKI